MAKIVLTNAYVLLGDIYDISSYITNISLSTTHDIIETTQFGDIYKTRIAGLGDNQSTFEFLQDFSSTIIDPGGLENVIYPLIGTAINCKIRPINTTVSASNPQYSFSLLISEWQPLSASVGELSTASVSWPISGEITKTTTP
jgi:hypothetical protein